MGRVSEELFMNFVASRFLCPYQNRAKVGNYEMARTHLNTMKFCGVELIYGLKITILGLYDLQIPYEGQRERPAVIVENQFFTNGVIAAWYVMSG